MIYLIEFEAYDPALSQVVIERLATDGYRTRPNDNPANIYFEERIINPGTFEQAVFDNGTTSGEARAGFGFVEIAISDTGNGETLDRLASYAVDGRVIKIYGLESTSSSWQSRKLVFDGVMEQIETSWMVATIRIRDRLEDLRVPIQQILYLGTTTDGTKTDAEGTPDDLKDRPKPLSFGVNRNIPAILSNRFRNVYDIGVNGLAAVNAVRDRGVALSNQGNQPSLAALLSASLQTGQFATFLAGGKIRVGGNPTEITVDATEGPSNGLSAARVVQRMLDFRGFMAGTDYSVQDLDNLHNLQPAPSGVWVSSEPRDFFSLITQVLDSVGAYTVPDENGVLRFGRIDAPSGGGPVIDQKLILDQGQGIERIVTNDESNGVPAKKVTLQYAPSWLVQNRNDLDQVNSTAEIRAFASVEYRSVVEEDANVAQIHLKASELFFTTLLTNETDARAEAARRLNLYKVRRDRYRVPLKAEFAEEYQLGKTVTLKLPRFDLEGGKPMTIIGREVVLPNRQSGTLNPGIITLDLYG